MMTDRLGNLVDGETSGEKIFTCDKCGERMNEEMVDRHGLLGGTCSICGDDLCKTCGEFDNAFEECMSCYEKIQEEEDIKKKITEVLEAWGGLRMALKSSRHGYNDLRDVMCDDGVLLKLASIQGRMD